MEPRLKPTPEEKIILPRKAVKFITAMVTMSKKLTDLIVTTRAQCQRLIKVEKTLLQKRVARYFIKRDIMLENPENPTCNKFFFIKTIRHWPSRAVWYNVRMKKMLALYYEPVSLFVFIYKLNRTFFIFLFFWYFYRSIIFDRSGVIWRSSASGRFLAWSPGV